MHLITANRSQNKIKTKLSEFKREKRSQNGMKEKIKPHSKRRNKIRS